MERFHRRILLPSVPGTSIITNHNEDTSDYAGFYGNLTGMDPTLEKMHKFPFFMVDVGKWLVIFLIMYYNESNLRNRKVRLFCRFYGMALWIF